MKKKKHKSFIEIDLFALEEEWMNQPGYYKDYADRLADAKLDVAEAKAELDLVKAELTQTMRTEPQKFGIKRPSEAAFESMLPLMKEYQLAVRDYNVAKHSVDLLTSAVDSLEHKKKALENLVQLEGRNYFASPRVPADAVARDNLSKKQKRAARVPLED